MELHKALVKRLITKSYGYRLSSPAVTLEHSPSTHAHSLVPPNALQTNFHREYITSPELSGKGFFRKFLQRRGINQSATRIPEFLSLPIGDKLREKLKGINIAGDRLRLEGLAPNVPDTPATDVPYGFTVRDARKLLRLSQVEKLKLKLREIQKSSISHHEFVRICVDFCENEDQGTEFAKLLDESGTVIVLGNIVYLRPEQVAKSMETLISESVATPNDRRREQLEQMEKQKAIIDQKAKALVRGELYCGLGFLVVQTLGFMRLTFWELSWDVMEPICFFVTSLHFAIAYGFFLRTSTEPTFEGFFHRRFKAKQDKLMKVHNFDVDKYNHLRKLFYPESLPNLDCFKSLNHEEGRALMFSK
ncbi:calcium uniporter protein 4, mitochondrial-like [Pistacia vera]|uniref:calcium uniporter protein 4, mitochondrial-like n=1 Tax=Pistacia vera TaxID=55513 RepID=UPI001262BC7C|nr:calcium uniporter protein 4, mitochondrial-like [Pistacia vera]XP_031254851.1 calcium uniporter protein 4, mitochondrial-like [Pistacia vera]